MKARMAIPFDSRLEDGARLDVEVVAALTIVESLRIAPWGAAPEAREIRPKDQEEANAGITTASASPGRPSVL